ncbi:MAG: hypothetical protein RLN90_09110 [Balneolaceae bacterium]
MKKSKIERKARILYLKSRAKTSDVVRSSEVTRALFSETWRSYLDEVNMVSINRKNRKETKVDNSKKTIYLSLVD